MAARGILLDIMSSKEIDTRSKILHACWDLMVDNLGQGVRMSDIAKAAGISRQALYLHFKTRADLFIATTRFMDDELGIGARLAPYREAKTGPEKLNTFIAFWAKQMTLIQGIARALIALKSTDAEAATAWDERMSAVLGECRATTTLLSEEGRLTPDLTPEEAARVMATSLSFQSWDVLTREADWSQKDYIARMQNVVARAILRP